MEGNDCYKYSTIQRFIRSTNAEQVLTIVDVGANIGDTLLLSHQYFPNANIIGYEPVYEYYTRALERTKGISQITLRNAACAGHHLFEDDLGFKRRKEESALRIYLALPESGPGWLGGSKVDLPNPALLSSSDTERCYRRLATNVVTRSLEALMSFETLEAIDLLKLDCEGSEFCLLGSASSPVLKRIRFITGEYHDIQRFYRIMEGRLFATHKVSLVGDRWQGSFFAERLDGERDGVLLYSRDGMKMPRVNLGDESICWNVFNERYVIDSERAFHGYPASHFISRASHAVSGYMLVLNEARCIEASLRCLAHYCDEVLVIDGGSTDGTFEKITLLALESRKIKLMLWPQHGVRYSESWCEPLRRNWAIKACSHDWILTIDADELLPELPSDYFHNQHEPLIFDTLNLLSKNEVIKGVQTNDGPEVWYPDPHVRFFNRSSARYTERPLHCVLENEDHEVLLGHAKHSGKSVLHYHAMVNSDRQWDNAEMRRRLELSSIDIQHPACEDLIKFIDG